MSHWYPGTTGSKGKRAPTSEMVGDLQNARTSRHPNLADCGKSKEASQGSEAVAARALVNRETLQLNKETGRRAGFVRSVTVARQELGS